MTKVALATNITWLRLLLFIRSYINNFNILATKYKGFEIIKENKLAADRRKWIKNEFSPICLRKD